ncbi:hypothetical protein BZM27_45710 [Paraburkholderia steynii]|uniref:Uncharacterized protein n=1 Tax=Paraburkholderia steynii TaxID=1245441 RepID=A0A4R0X182_9BURK|nr:hypothetical protein BZM27_45710 [Paraburkholderia steynii]
MVATGSYNAAAGCAIQGATGGRARFFAVPDHAIYQAAERSSAFIGNGIHAPGFAEPAFI